MTEDTKQGSTLLVDEWKQAYKLWSVIAAALLAGFDTLHGLLPALQSLVSPQAFTWINAGSAVAIVVLRVMKQGAGDDTTPTSSPTPSTPKEPSA